MFNMTKSSLLVNLIEQSKILNSRIDSMKKQVKQESKKTGKLFFPGLRGKEGISVSHSTRTGLDQTRLKEEQPELFEKYLRQSEVVSVSPVKGEALEEITEKIQMQQDRIEKQYIATLAVHVAKEKAEK